MSAIAEPTNKKSPEFKKSPVKYHYRLKAGIKAKSSEWTGGQGKVLSVLSSVAYLTARDVSNQLRIEPHVAQGLLQRLLIRGAVERRIIPGSIHDEATKVAAKESMSEAKPDEKVGFDKRIIAGSIVRHDVGGLSVVSERVNDFFLKVYSLSLKDTQHYRIPGFVEFIKQTPNPIAFNQGRFSECFSAPVVEPLKTKNTEFVIGDIIMNDAGDPHKVVDIVDGKAIVQSMVFDERPWEAISSDIVGAWWKFAAPKPKNPLVEAISEKVEEAEKEKFPFKVGDVVILHRERYRIEELTHDGTMATVSHKCGDRYSMQTPSAFRNAKLVEEPKFHVARPELLPNDALSEVSKVFGLGADKYARDDWAKPDNGGGDHIEAAVRHLVKHRNGHRLEVGESGSGLPHLYHAAARLLMAIGKEMRNK